MDMRRPDLAYRKTTAEAAGGLGLLIALFDTLAGDLQRAARAQRNADVGGRCREIHHALLILGMLEDWVSRGPGGQLADELIEFYSSLRRNLISAQAGQSAEQIDQQMTRVLNLREQWQRIELFTAPSGPQITQPVFQSQPEYPGLQPETRHGSWLA